MILAGLKLRITQRPAGQLALLRVRIALKSGCDHEAVRPPQTDRAFAKQRMMECTYY